MSSFDDDASPSLVIDALRSQVPLLSPKGDLEVVRAWADSPASICVVFRRASRPGVISGRRFAIHGHPRRGDPQSSGELFAQTLLEPQGTDLPADEFGVVWSGDIAAGIPRSP
jgi:hypothetical protein